MDTRTDPFASSWADPFGLPPPICNTILNRKHRARALLAERRKARESLPPPSQSRGHRPAWADTLPVAGGQQVGKAVLRRMPDGTLCWPLGPSPQPPPRPRCMSAEPMCLVSPMRVQSPRRSTSSVGTVPPARAAKPVPMGASPCASAKEITHMMREIVRGHTKPKDRHKSRPINALDGLPQALHDIIKDVDNYEAGGNSETDFLARVQREHKKKWNLNSQNVDGITAFNKLAKKGIKKSSAAKRVLQGVPLDLEAARASSLNCLTTSIMNSALKFCPPRNGVPGITLEECRAWRSGARGVHPKIMEFGDWLLYRPSGGVFNFFLFDDDKSGHMDMDELKVAIVEWQKSTDDLRSSSEIFKRSSQTY